MPMQHLQAVCSLGRGGGEQDAPARQQPQGAARICSSVMRVYGVLCRCCAGAAAQALDKAFDTSTDICKALKDTQFDTQTLNKVEKCRKRVGMHSFAPMAFNRQPSTCAPQLPCGLAPGHRRATQPSTCPLQPPPKNTPLRSLPSTFTVRATSIPAPAFPLCRPLPSLPPSPGHCRAPVP